MIKGYITGWSVSTNDHFTIYSLNGIKIDGSKINFYSRYAENNSSLTKEEAKRIENNLIADGYVWLKTNMSNFLP